MKKYRELMIGLIMFTVGAVYYALAFDIKQFSAGKPGIITSDFVPKIYGILVMLLSVILIIRAVAGLRKSRPSGTEEEHEEATDSKWKLPVEKETVLTFLCLLIYVALLRSIGFVIMSILFIMGMSYILLPYDRRSKKTYLLIFVIGVVFTIVITVIFVRGFNLTLPMGVLA